MCAAVNGMTPSCMRAFASGYTVTRIENGSDAKQSTVAALRGALEMAGVEFIAVNRSPCRRFIVGAMTVT
jgi:hypothetical protein